MKNQAKPLHPDPTPAEILRATEEIRSKWSRKETVRRTIYGPRDAKHGIGGMETEIHLDQWGRPIVPVYVTEVRWSDD